MASGFSPLVVLAASGFRALVASGFSRTSAVASGFSALVVLVASGFSRTAVMVSRFKVWFKVSVVSGFSHGRRRVHQELALHLVERKPVGGGRRLPRLHLASELRDGLLEIGIVTRERQRRAVLRQRFGKRSAPVVDLGQPADGGEIFRRALQDEIEGGLRLVELIQLDQGAPERDAGGQVSGVNREAGPADLDRFLMLSSAPAFLGELGEGDRRRILVDPAPQIVNSVVVGHRLFTAP